MAKKITAKTIKPQRPYPRVSLEDALKIPTAIKEKNGGNAWPPAEIAAAIGASPKASGFSTKPAQRKLMV